MQVTNAISNTIRILFNPTVESFKLFDFLIVQSNESRYLAQIIEIYDDKFDASQNVAKLKLFYKITPENEVLPYDNFTPNKECEIMKINPQDIEGFTNQNKETFPFALSVQSKQPLNIQYDFFNSKAIVLADKIENSNAMTLSLATKLCEKSNVVIIDFSGALEYKKAKTISAAKDFKLPLNYHTIDYIFSNCLNELNFKFKASGEQILNEIKAYAKSQENGYIPINLLVNVFEQQYKATPYDELKILLERIRTCEIEGIFAKTKKDYETLDKTIQENKITILNFSTIPTSWQKAYVEHVALDCREDIYLIARVNEDIFDVGLINRIYNKSPNVKLIPCASYSFKKLPTIMQYCKNYILLPSLYQRTDFLDANFALSNLISTGCIIFGENTDNFLYLATDYEINFVEKKNYRKIALSLMKEDGENMEGFETELKEQNKISDSQKLIKELSELEQSNSKKAESEEDLPLEEKEEDDTQYFQNNEESELSEIPQQAPQEPEMVEEETEVVEEETQEEQVIDVEEVASTYEEPSQDLIAQAAQEAMEEEAEEAQEIEETEELQEAQEEIVEEELEEFKEINSKKSVHIDDDVEEEITEITTNVDIQEDEEIKEEEEEERPDFSDIVDSDKKSLTIDDDVEAYSIDDDVEVKEEVKEEKKTAKKQTKKASKKTSKEETKTKAKSKKASKEESVKEEKKTAKKSSKAKTAKKESAPVELSDEELDYFDLMKNDFTNDDKDNLVIEDSAEVDIFKEETNEVQKTPVEENFENIINNETKADELNFSDEDEQITLEDDSETLPVFKEERKHAQNPLSFESGNIVHHQKYGKGVITKIIKYDERQLLQIEFAQAGRKLLDPQVAQITLE